MKKHKHDDAGATWLVSLDPAKFVEPRENPQDLPLALTCGGERWCRSTISAGRYQASYRHHRYSLPISVHCAGADFGWTQGEGIWVLCACCGQPMHTTACKTFGEAVAFVRSYQKTGKRTFVHAYQKAGK